MLLPLAPIPPQEALKQPVAAVLLAAAERFGYQEMKAEAASVTEGGGGEDGGEAGGGSKSKARRKMRRRRQLVTQQMDG